MPGETVSLAGRAALITGAGTGIGRAIANALADAGAFVGLHCHRSVEGANETLNAIRSRGGNGVVLSADLVIADQATQLVDQFVVAAGRLDILINNAGSPIERQRIEDCSLELWRQVLDVNLTSAFLVTQRAIPHLKASGNGAIVNNERSRSIRRRERRLTGPHSHVGSRVGAQRPRQRDHAGCHRNSSSRSLHNSRTNGTVPPRNPAGTQWQR